MKSTRISVLGSVLCLMVLALLTGCRTAPADKQSGRGFHFPVGVAYVAGFDKVLDIYRDRLGKDIDSTIPIGLVFDPYYQWESGLAVGAGVGPLMMASGDIDLVNIPVNIHGRYYFVPESNFSPYLKAGLSYNIASGDYVEGSQLGVFGGVGLEFYRSNSLSWGLEAIFDTSSIEFERTARNSTRNVKPIAFKVGVFIIF
jgi:hypothetical protein